MINLILQIDNVESTSEKANRFSFMSFMIIVILINSINYKVSKKPIVTFVSKGDIK